MKKIWTIALPAFIFIGNALAAEPDAALRELAENGDAEAQYQMARFYERQNETEKAVPWYEKAVAQQHAKAQNNLGALYMWGKGVAKDTEKGCRLIEASHKQMGTLTGTLNVAACNDQRAHPDFHKAFGNYRIAAEKGDAAAMRLLGQMYASGDGRVNAIAAYIFMKSAQVKRVVTDEDAFRKVHFAENLAEWESKIPAESKAQFRQFDEEIQAQPMKNILEAIDKLVPLDEAAKKAK